MSDWPGNQQRRDSVCEEIGKLSIWHSANYLDLNIKNKGDHCGLQKDKTNTTTTRIACDILQILRSDYYRNAGLVQKHPTPREERAAETLLYTLTLRSFQVDKTIVQLSHRALIETVLTFSIICRFSHLTLKGG